METKKLQEIANHLRLEAVRMVWEAKDGHPGPALSIADIVATLYFDELKVDPKNPQWPDRDRFILSKGHACPIVYAALNEKGYFKEKIEHFDLRALYSMFQGHPVSHKTPGIDSTSGSLGNGISIGAGMAIAGKFHKKDYRVYVIVGDGELQEGVCWEGINVAAKYHLDNMVVFVDRNGWQSGGTVQEVIGDNNVNERFASFGWHILEIDGHDIDQIKAALKEAKKVQGKPVAIICDCIKGKGLDYMENNNAWHKGVPTDEQYEQAKIQLQGGNSK
jgi:transketolase